MAGTRQDDDDDNNHGGFLAETGVIIIKLTLTKEKVDSWAIYFKLINHFKNISSEWNIRR